MPVHDWTRVSAGDFHHFHNRWLGDLAAALNGGALPPGYSALAEPITGKYSPDVVTLQTARPPRPGRPTATAVAEPPAAPQRVKLERSMYARRKDRIAVRHDRGRVVAVIEVVSPGIKDSRHAVRSFVEKSADLLDQGVHLLVIDLFPPTPRDPGGLSRLILDQFDDTRPADASSDQPLTVASFAGGILPEAFVYPLRVGDSLPAAPLFLSDHEHVPCPLEATYQQAWGVLPADIQDDLTPEVA